MKRKKNLLLLISTITIVTFGSIYWDTTKVRLSDLALANIDALANKIPPTAAADCAPANDGSCSFVVATPNGNHVETYFDARPIYP